MKCALLPSAGALDLPEAYLLIRSPWSLVYEQVAKTKLKGEYGKVIALQSNGSNLRPSSAVEETPVPEPYTASSCNADESSNGDRHESRQ